MKTIFTELWQGYRDQQGEVSHSGQVTTSRLEEGRRERHGMNPAWLWEKRFIFPAAVTKLRELPDRPHPGSEGMESRGGGNKPSSLLMPPHLFSPPAGKGPPVVRPVEVTLRAHTEQGKKNGELIGKRQDGLPLGEFPALHGCGPRSSLRPLLGPVQSSIPGGAGR